MERIRQWGKWQIIENVPKIDLIWEELWEKENMSDKEITEFAKKFNFSEENARNVIKNFNEGLYI